MTIAMQISLSSHLLCEGIKKLVSETAVNVICEWGANTKFSYEPDIVLFDSKTKICALKSQYPNAKFVLLDTGMKEIDISRLLLCHHISGIISPEEDIESLCKAIRVIHGGDIWIDQKHLKSLIKKGHSLPEGEGFKGLSVQDKKIVALASQGMTNNEISESVCLSETTIKAHLCRIYKMLKIRNRVELALLTQEYNEQEL